MYAINTLRRYACNTKPYGWIIKIELKGESNGKEEERQPFKRSFFLLN
jgi:hypothetical protein